jgi:flavin-dependent dehydrogenase
MSSASSQIASPVGSAPALVIGGGLAGSMVALRLASAGRPVTLLEREHSAHHKVCGEFLSREAVDYLEAAGVDLVSLGAQPIHTVRLTSKSRTVECQLPFTALSLSRSVLDEALLSRAAQAGCKVRRGAFVESLTYSNSRWHAALRGGDTCTAPTVFLASGKHDLRGFERLPGPHGDLIGFKLHLRLAAAQTSALREAMELYLFPGGYGGISLVEGDVANLCLVIRRANLRKLGGWPQLFRSIQERNPHLAQRLQNASTLWDRPLAVSSIPYGYLAGRTHGLWSVGDQAACIPSFTGDGMSIALHSAASADTYHRRLATQLRRGMSLATALSRTLVTPLGRTVAPVALSLYPGAFAWIARSTRIPASAIDPQLA